jgi:hypothetical protein
MAETRGWLRNDGNGSDSLAPDSIRAYERARYIRFVDFSFLILIARFASLET